LPPTAIPASLLVTPYQPDLIYWQAGQLIYPGEKITIICKLVNFLLFAIGATYDGADLPLNSTENLQSAKRIP